jgi:GMP synthase-like glutamine amidotransferase
VERVERAEEALIFQFHPEKKATSEVHPSMEDVEDRRKGVVCLPNS